MFLSNMQLVVMQLVVIMLLTQPGWADDARTYEELTVSNGGSIEGKVTLSGTVPKPKGYNLTTLPDPIYCGRISDGKGWRLVQPFDVGPHGEFRQVVVRLEGVEKGKAFPAAMAPRIHAVDCQFLPFVNVVRDQQEVVVVNMDPAMHDIQAYETSQLGPRVLFNIPLPISPRYPNEVALSAHFHEHYAGVPMTQTVKMTKGRRVFTMQCGFHAYMESWALVPDNPYFSLTDADGRFRLDEVPPGSYTLSVWHPYVRQAYEQTVTVRANVPAEANFEVQAPTGRLYANQMVEEAYTRYTITEDVQSQIVPTLEKQRY
jgi:hypothetical protein